MRCFKALEELRHAEPKMVWTCVRLEVHRARNTNFQCLPSLKLLATVVDFVEFADSVIQPPTKSGWHLVNKFFLTLELDNAAY